MARPKLTVFLDVVSPFAYIGFYITRNSATFKDCDISYVPILLGGLMQKCKNTTPLDIINKGKWIQIERRRHTALFRVPITGDGPQPFPQSTVNTQRALCAVSLLHPNKLGDAFAAMYTAFWVETKVVNKPESISGALSKVFSAKEVEAIMAKIGDPAVKKLLTDNTEKAFSEGAFGLPWFLAENTKGEKEAFWGVDHLGQVIDHLGLKREGAGLRSLL